MLHVKNESIIKLFSEGIYNILLVVNKICNMEIETISKNLNLSTVQGQCTIYSQVN